MKQKLRHFYCNKCKKHFNTSTYFGRDEFSTWCIFCGAVANERSKSNRKDHCNVCRKRLVRNQVKFCSSRCRYSFYNKEVNENGR